MKKAVMVTIALALPLTAMAQERAIGVALERFATIAGGWWLNQRCKILSTDEAAAFRRDLSVVNVSLSATLDDASTILRLQGSAKRASEEPRYSSCSDEVREIVTHTASTVSLWATDVRRAVLEGAAKLPGPR